MVYVHEERLRRLCASLAKQVEQTTDLTLGPAGRHDCVLRLSSTHGPVSVLEISSDEVTVTTRSNGLHADAGTSEIVDVLGIDLSNGYAWDAVDCESADDLAYLLVKHMRRRVRDADPEPSTGPNLETQRS